MPFDNVDAYIAIQDLNIKFNYLYETLVEKGIIKEMKEDDKKEKKKEKLNK